MDEQMALLALSLVPGVGSGRLHRLLKIYKTASTAWHARAEWGTHPAIGERVARGVAQVDERRVEAAYRRLKSLGGRILVRTDPDYPRGLTRMSTGRTPVLFVRGQVPPEEKMCVAIVGTRRASGGGLQLTTEMASQLAAVGMTVVSGMALGIDGAAHRGALRVGGKTVAVLGCGLDYAYPPQHAELMEEIANTGAVITEYTIGTEPLPHHFPARNRIIAGLSAGVVVVESGATGGALHTVDYAAAAGREVMAVPGDVFRWQSEAPNQLIRDGAFLVRNAADVLHVLGHTSWPARLSQTDSKQVGPSTKDSDVGVKGQNNEQIGRIIAERLRVAGAMSVDELAEATKFPVATVAATVTWMEVVGQVIRTRGGRFRPAG